MNNSRDELIKELFTVSFKFGKTMSSLSNLTYEEKMATALQFQALAYLKENPNTTAGELAQKLLLSSASVAQLSDRLVQNNWIVRENDISDRRLVRLSLAKAGIKELSRLSVKKMELMRPVLDSLSQHDLEELLRIVNKILANLPTQNV